MFFLNRITALADEMYLLLPLAVVISVFIIIWIFREPFNGTLLIFLVIPIILPIIGSASDGSSFWNIRLHNVFTVITFCALLAAILRHKYQGFASTVLVIPFGLYCLANVLSLFNTPYLVSSIRQFMKLLGANVAMYMVITTTLNSRARLEKVIKILLGIGLLLSFVETVQYTLSLFFGIDSLLRIMGARKAAAAFAERGWFPQYMGVMFTIALPLYFSKAFKSWKPWLAFCLCVFGVVIASGLNRSSYVTVIVVILTAYALKVGGERSRYLMRIAIVSILALAVASFIPSFFEKELQLVRIRRSGEMFSPDEPSNARRVDLAEVTLKHIEAHPFIGRGFGSWGRVVPPQTVKGGGSQGGSCFNIFLGVLYDGGILGLIALGLICYCYLRACFRTLRNVNDPYQQTMLYIAILMFVDIFVTAQFHPTWLAGYAWLAMAMGMAIVNIVKREISNENSLHTAQLKSRWWE